MLYNGIYNSHNIFDKTGKTHIRNSHRRVGVGNLGTWKPRVKIYVCYVTEYIVIIFLTRLGKHIYEIYTTAHRIHILPVQSIYFIVAQHNFMSKHNKLRRILFIILSKKFLLLAFLLQLAAFSQRCSLQGGKRRGTMFNQIFCCCLKCTSIF